MFARNRNYRWISLQCITETKGTLQIRTRKQLDFKCSFDKEMTPEGQGWNKRNRTKAEQTKRRFVLLSVNTTSETDTSLKLGSSPKFCVKLKKRKAISSIRSSRVFPAKRAFFALSALAKRAGYPIIFVAPPFTNSLYAVTIITLCPRSPWREWPVCKVFAIPIQSNGRNVHQLRFFLFPWWGPRRSQQSNVWRRRRARGRSWGTSLWL